MSEFIKINITGFGQFGDVKDNPSQTLINRLQQENPQFSNIIINQTDILDVNISACDQYFLGNYFEDVDICLHLGVACGRQLFTLEQFGYNMADFPIPDTEGNKFSEQQIDQNLTIDQNIETSLRLNKVQEQLLELQHKVGISSDPGRYICNFIQQFIINFTIINKFYNLKHYKEFYNFNIQIYQSFTSLLSFQNTNTHSLFCHVPSFDQIDEETQFVFLKDLIYCLGNQLIKDKKVSSNQKDKPQVQSFYTQNAVQAQQQQQYAQQYQQEQQQQQDQQYQQEQQELQQQQQQQSQIQNVQPQIIQPQIIQPYIIQPQNIQTQIMQPQVIQQQLPQFIQQKQQSPQNIYQNVQLVKQIQMPCKIQSTQRLINNQIIKPPQQSCQLKLVNNPIQRKPQCINRSFQNYSQIIPQQQLNLVKRKQSNQRCSIQGSIIKQPSVLPNQVQIQPQFNQQMIKTNFQKMANYNIYRKTMPLSIQSSVVTHR